MVCYSRFSKELGQQIELRIPDKHVSQRTLIRLR